MKTYLLSQNVKISEIFPEKIRKFPENQPLPGMWKFIYACDFSCIVFHFRASTNISHPWLQVGRQDRTHHSSVLGLRMKLMFPWLGRH